MLRTPAISVVIPARNEGARVAQTIASAVAACESPHDIEVVVVDDCSAPAARPDLTTLARREVPVRVIRAQKHLGVGAARNLAIRHASGDVLFITDAHVQFSPAWDLELSRLIEPQRILAATICNKDASRRRFGCRLVVPHMGTRWNRCPPDSAPEVQIASSAGTVLSRALFAQLGGYDEGMLHYGGFEPEFSVRAWCCGAEIVLAPSIEIAHRFKPANERTAFVAAARTAIVHNWLRFGVIHLPEPMIPEMVRLHAVQFPGHIQDALRLLERRGAWRRRDEFAQMRKHDFGWFVDRFALRDQAGRPIPMAGTL